MIIEDWGRIDYSQSRESQKNRVESVIAGAQDHLIFCEHPAVLTLGRQTRPDSLLYDRLTIEARGCAIQEVDRGGDVTLHAPGQLVVYPIFNLNNCGRDLKMYMAKLQQVAIDLLKDFGILAISIPGQRGVFVEDPARGGTGPEKIISIGVGVRRWVTYHGLGINVNTDLSLFGLILPCGLNVRMTSMQKLKGHAVPLKDVKARAVEQFQKHFNDMS